MLPNLFSHPVILTTGAIAGFLFGFLLQKGKLTQFSTIVGQLLLKDFTMLKIFTTTIIVGSIGIYALLAVDLPITMHVKTGSIIALVLGGIIMGKGMAILGYCPGTCVAAAGQGSRDAWCGILGMIFGALAYAETHFFFERFIHPITRVTKTIPDTLNISPWILIIILSVISFGGFKLLKWKQKFATPSVSQPQSTQSVTPSDKIK